MPDPVGRRLDVAVHDGRGGADAERVGGGDDLDPLVHRDPAARDDVADLVVEDLGGRAGQRAEARRLQLAEILGDRQRTASTPYSTSSGENAWMWRSGSASWIARQRSM